MTRKKNKNLQIFVKFKTCFQRGKKSIINSIDQRDEINDENE